jgi:hypothetical protein
MLGRSPTRQPTRARRQTKETLTRPASASPIRKIGLIPTIVLPYAFSMFVPVWPSLGCMALLAERLILEKTLRRLPSGFADVEGTLDPSEGVGGGRGVDFGSDM